MTTVSSDRLTYLETLKAAGIPEAQARAHAVALDEALRDSVATKADLKELELRLEAKIETLNANSRAELVKWVVGVAFAQGALILTVLKLFPGGHP